MLLVVAPLRFQWLCPVVVLGVLAVLSWVIARVCVCV